MRAIYAENLKQLVDEEWFDCQEKSSFFDEIDRTPTIDAMPVVRCKDCMHRENKKWDSPCPCVCADSWYSWMPEDDWFCANGKERE